MARHPSSCTIFNDSCQLLPVLFFIFVNDKHFLIDAFIILEK